MAVFVGAKSRSNLALLEGRESEDGKTKIYVCRNKVCKLPVDSSAAALNQIMAS
jgi:uncharacterized protein YyaL (SSP411 family)